MPRYTIHPDILQARTLPGRFYHDEAAYEQLKEAMFARAWHWLGVRDAVKEAGSVFPSTLLAGLLDEPVLLSHAKDGQIRCLSNVCTHRGNLLVTKAGKSKALRCRYHGRRFGLDGKCEHMPAWEEHTDFPQISDHLPELPMGRWGKFLFASLHPFVDFGEWLHGLEERVGWIPTDQMHLDSGRSKTYEFEAHWALYVDNYLEGFHIPFVHKSLNAALDFSKYETILLPHGNVQIGIAAEGEPCFDLPHDHPDEGKRVAAFYFWFFPNLMLKWYPWGMSINIVEPLGLKRTRVRFITYVWNPSLLDQGAGAGLDRVELEDEDIVLQVQKGVGARMYGNGQYSPRMERGVHQFHRMLVGESIQ